MFLWETERAEESAAGQRHFVLFAVCLQIKNHFSVPFTILKYCPTSRRLQSIGQAEPETEFHVTLEAYR